MSAEVGYFALLLSLGFMSSNLIFFKIHEKGELQLNTFMAFAGVLTAYVILTIAFVLNDFSIAYVARLSSTRLPDMYRYTALWGGHEGSFLLWVFILSAWSAWVACVSSFEKVVLQRTLCLLSLIGIALVGFLIFSSDPFLRIIPVSPPMD